MDIDKYNEIADKYKVSNHLYKNSLISFISGGFIGFISELYIELLIYIFNIDRNTSSSIMCITVIGLTCLFTSMGFMDNLFSKFKCGLIVPTTGFAHSISSSVIDSKREGLIAGIGCNAFKLAGTVILYGVFSASVISIIRYYIGG